MPPSKEDFLERKIVCLEKRLTLVERFVELRFCESIKDFSIRSDDNSPPRGRSAGPGPGRKKNVEKNIKLKPSPDPPPVKVPGRRGRPPKAAKTPVKVLEDPSPGPSDNISSPNEVRVRKHPLQSRPGPASMKRKAMEKAEADSAKISKRGEEDMKDCVVRVMRYSVTENTNASRRSVSTPLGPRARRTPVVKEEIIEDYTRKPRYNTRRKRRGEEEEDDGNGSNAEEIQTEPAMVDPVEDHIEDAVVLGHQDSNNTDENEEEESYFIFPTNATVRGENVDDNDLSHVGDVDELGLQTEDPSDGNWSGAEDEEDEDIIVKPKRARIPRKSVATGAKRGRKRLEDSDTPRRRTYISAKFEALPTDAIAGSDPSKKECPVCHKHFKNEMIVNHMQGHMKERHLKCPHCDKTYFNQAMLRKHMRVHQPEKYGKKCRLCEKIFYQSDKVLAHERFCVKKALEKNEPVDSAIIDDLKRRSSAGWIDDALQTPKAEVGIDLERKKCPYCKKSFQAHIYDRHVKTHETTRNWACNLCEKAYFHKHDLVRHVATEHVQNPTCDICQTSFMDRASLKQHLTACRREQRKRESIKIKSVTSLQPTDRVEVNVKDEIVDTNSKGSETGVSAMEIPETETTQGTVIMEEHSTELMQSTGEVQGIGGNASNLSCSSQEMEFVSTSHQQASLVLVTPHAGVENETVTFVIEEIRAPEVVAEEEIVST